MGATVSATHDINDAVRLSAEFKNRADAFTDPTTVYVKVETPAGVEAKYTWALTQVTKESTGKFYYVLTLTEAGDYYIEFGGTGTVHQVAKGRIHVRASRFSTV